MLRIFKPRSPMSMGAWAMTLFGGLGAAAVAADLTRRPRLARALGGANAVVGGYFGSYTGVLLSSTAVPVWARSRLFLGPIFVATGAAASRLVLVGAGLPAGHPTREALGRVEAGAIATDLALSAINQRRLGELSPGLEQGAAGRLFRGARRAVLAGLGLRLARRGPPSPTISPACCTSPGASPSATPGWRPGGARPPTMGRSRAAPVGSSSEEPVVAERDLAREALHQVQSQPPVSICHSYTNHGEGSSNSCCCAGRNRVNAAWATARFRALMRRI
jgi:hypothetical protein